MKKLLSVLLCCVMLFGMMSVSVSATGEATAETDRLVGASKWDGTPLTISSLENAYTFEGSGTEASPYLIQSAEDLAKLSANVRFENYTTNYAGKYFKLTCDLDFQNYGWYGIGGVETDTGNLWRDNKKRFEGIFDGDNHVIYNFNLVSEIDGKPVYVNGLFGHAGEGAVIKNVGIASGSVNLGRTDRVGLLLGVARYNLTVENCFNKADLTINVPADEYTHNQFRVGGLVGAVMNKDSSKHIFKDCYNAGDVTVVINKDINPCVGGLIGYLADGNNAIDNCYNTGDISVKHTVRTAIPWENQAQGVYQDYQNGMGSLIGTFAFMGNISITNCGVDGTVTFENTASTAKTINCGKFLGFTASQITFTNITDSVEVTATGLESTYSNSIVCLGQNTQPEATVAETLTLPLPTGELYFLNAEETVAPPVDDNPPSTGDDIVTGTDPIVTEPVTSAPETDAPTTKEPESNSTEQDVGKKSGCGSVITSMGMATVFALAIGALAIRKKED